MSEDVQNVDDLFRGAIEPHKEIPSLNVWNRLQSQLDKEDATIYKRKFIIARRMAFALLFLLLSVVIYETSISWNGSNKSVTQNDKRNNEANKIVYKTSETSLSVVKNDTKKKLSNTQLLSNTQRQSFITNKETNASQKPVNKNEDLHKLSSFNMNILEKLNTPLNTGQIVGETSNIVPYAKLTFPDSFKQTNKAGQKQNQGNPFKPYWTVTGIASQEWSQYSLENDLPDNINNPLDEKTEIEQREKHKFSFTAGALVSYQFKKHWGLQSGLIYSNTSIAIEPQKIYAAKDASGIIAYKYNASSGYAFITPDFGLPFAAINGISVGDSISTTSAQHNLTYLSVPIILKYKIEAKKFSISPGVGISGNFLTSAKIKTEIENAFNKETITIKKLEGTKSFYLGVMASTDIQYNLNQKWSLTVMPYFKYALSSITRDNVVKTLPHSFGVAIGVSIKL